MAFDRKSLSNSSATGNDVNIFTYGTNGAADATAAIVASGFFNEAKDVLKHGNVIVVSDGSTTQTVTVTSVTGAIPVTVA